MEPYTTDVILTDGGVYDNLGLETAWKRYRTILVSDGGSGLCAEPEPKNDWARHALRVYDLTDNQVRSLRKRQVVDSLRAGKRAGAYWGIGSDIADYRLQDSLPWPVAKTKALAAIPTRLKGLESGLQERLSVRGVSKRWGPTPTWPGCPTSPCRPIWEAGLSRNLSRVHEVIV